MKVTVICVYWYEKYVNSNEFKKKKKNKLNCTLNHIKLIINPNLSQT